MMASVNGDVTRDPLHEEGKAIASLVVFETVAESPCTLRLVLGAMGCISASSA